MSMSDLQRLGQEFDAPDPFWTPRPPADASLPRRTAYFAGYSDGYYRASFGAGQEGARDNADYGTAYAHGYADAAKLWTAAAQCQAWTWSAAHGGYIRFDHLKPERSGQQWDDYPSEVSAEDACFIDGIETVTQALACITAEAEAAKTRHCDDCDFSTTEADCIACPHCKGSVA